MVAGLKYKLTVLAGESACAHGDKVDMAKFESFRSAPCAKTLKPDAKFFLCHVEVWIRSIRRTVGQGCKPLGCSIVIAFCFQVVVKAWENYEKAESFKCEDVDEAKAQQLVGENGSLATTLA